jgi:hypothetical protein
MSDDEIDENRAGQAVEVAKVDVKTRNYIDEA